MTGSSPSRFCQSHRGGEEATRERFRREARIAARLNHPNIVQVYAYGETRSALYYVMAYVDGESLAQRMEHEGALGESELEDLLRSVASALDHAHRRGLIHRDIKPSNILLDHDTGRILLTDFGIGRVVGAARFQLGEGQASSGGITSVGTVLGTPEYMAPEQLSDSSVDGRADLYALGLTAYVAASGEMPFRASTPEAVIAKKLSTQPEPLVTAQPKLARRVSHLIDRCMQTDPAQRPDTAQRVLALLEGDDPNTQPSIRRLGILNRHVVVPFLAGNVAASWALLAMVDTTADVLNWPTWAFRFSVVALIPGLLTSAVAEWLFIHNRLARIPQWFREWGGVLLALANGGLALAVMLAVAAVIQ